jgi:hypothetical protein
MKKDITFQFYAPIYLETSTLVAVFAVAMLFLQKKLFFMGERNTIEELQLVLIIILILNMLKNPILMS